MSLWILVVIEFSLVGSFCFFLLFMFDFFPSDCRFWTSETIWTFSKLSSCSIQNCGHIWLSCSWVSWLLLIASSRSWFFQCHVMWWSKISTLTIRSFRYNFCFWGKPGTFVTGVWPQRVMSMLMELFLWNYLLANQHLVEMQILEMISTSNIALWWNM